MATDIDILKDENVNCYSVMVQLSVEEYLKMVNSTFENRGGLEGQRDTLKTTTAIRIRNRMVQDIEAGAVIPPIVIGVIVPEDIFSTLHTLDRKSFLDLMEKNDIDSISIIDGMQRTTAISEVLKNTDTDISQKKIRIEYWIASQVNSLIYRMLVLNTGQVPWNIRRQIEIVFRPIIKELEKKSPSVEILINEEKRRSAPGQFQDYNVIELFLVWGARKEKIDLQERVADEFMKQDLIESVANSNFTNIFYEVIDYLGKFDKVIGKYKDKNSEGHFKNGKDLFGSLPACVGFVTAIGLSVLGRPGSDHNSETQNEKWDKIKNDADRMLQYLSSLNSSQMASFLDFPTLNELIGKKPAKSNEREFFLQAFKALIEEKFQVSKMTPCWRAY
jgi:hypothetical protein